jgi:hypothetical protein
MSGRHPSRMTGHGDARACLSDGVVTGRARRGCCPWLSAGIGWAYFVCGWRHALTLRWAVIAARIDTAFVKFPVPLLLAPIVVYAPDVDVPHTLIVLADIPLMRCGPRDCRGSQCAECGCRRKHCCCQCRAFGDGRRGGVGEYCAAVSRWHDGALQVFEQLTGPEMSGLGGVSPSSAGCAGPSSIRCVLVAAGLP